MTFLLADSAGALLAQGNGSTTFFAIAGVFAVGMLLWDCIEVGRNDAANLINALFGARVLTVRKAVTVAAVGVVLGAGSSSPVMETARNGIFDPAQLTVEHAVAVYVSVYIVDTVLLYGFSAFGMPVSTTACLVFELLGASFALGGFEIVHWNKAGTVILAIICSIIVSGIAAFFVQRAVRGAVRERTTNLTVLLAHGSWIGGAMLAGLSYFMIVKGMKHVSFIQTFNKEVVDAYGPALVVLLMWAIFGALIHASLVMFGRRASKLVFPVLAVLGTFAMAFAFGQNDLANCASPGLAAVNLIKHQELGTAKASKIDLEWWTLAGCGVLMAMGMFTKNAQRVTRAAVNAGSQSNTVRLWAPAWCIATARYLLRFRGREPVLAPPPQATPAGKALHYDVLRACVILGVSASVIATASGFGLPVSSTYVSFAAIVATGFGDRIMHRRDADLKLGRTIWVVFSWFAGAVVAAVFAAGVCRTVYHLSWVGMILALLANLAARWYLKKRADQQEARVRFEADERRHPERFAETSEDY
jgi:phosphate/sulfate permease